MSKYLHFDLGRVITCFTWQESQSNLSYCINMTVAMTKMFSMGKLRRDAPTKASYFKNVDLIFIL